MGLGFRVWGSGFRAIWGSYYNIPKATFYLLYTRRLKDRNLRRRRSVITFSEVNFEGSFIGNQAYCYLIGSAIRNPECQSA